MRFSTPPTGLATLPNRLSTTLLPSSTPFPRNPTSAYQNMAKKKKNRADLVFFSRDSTLIMQLLRDNLTLWTSDMNEPG